MNHKPRFFSGLSYTLIVLFVFSALLLFSETLGMHPLGEPIIESASLAFVNFLLSIWAVISIGMMIQKRKNGLTLFNASFGANIISTFKESYESPWEIAFSVATTVFIFYYYNRNSVKAYLND